MTTGPTNAQIEELMSRPPSVPDDGPVGRAKQDLAIAERTAVLDELTSQVHLLRGRLEQAGWTTRLSDLEQTAPNGVLKCQVTYTGGEFVAGLSDLPGAPSRRTTIRITPALFGRQPNCISLLAEVLVVIGDGHPHILHLDPSLRVAIGLEADGLLFGERDEGPPDMSGSTPGVER